MSEHDLLNGFTKKLTDDLTVNEVLRNAWVEYLVARALGLDSAATPWSFSDLRCDGRALSVRHGLGPAATFPVARDGTGARGEPRYRRDAYVFAWLSLDDAETVSPDAILSADRWQYKVAARATMESHFTPSATTTSLAGLDRVGSGWVSSRDLRGLLSAVPEGVPDGSGPG